MTISAQKTFRMLNAVIDTKGDLLEEKKPRYEMRIGITTTVAVAVDDDARMP